MNTNPIRWQISNISKSVFKHTEFEWSLANFGGIQFIFEFELPQFNGM